MLKNKSLKAIGTIITIVIIALNIIAAIHAYKFTHFTNEKVKKTKHPDSLSKEEKLKLLFTGISNPRPVDTIFPEEKFEDIQIKSNKVIDCWYIHSTEHKGTVILFHGYGSSKSGLIKNAQVFVDLQYDVLLVDFMGSGGSEGNQTTIGYKEAQEVKSSFNYVYSKGEKNILLYGTSMGAASILKALYDYKLNTNGVILECPFGTMYRSVCNRFKNMGIPSFPMAPLLTFWGGIENHFWAFSYTPDEYAKSVKCPVLLMYGSKDKNVGRDEINGIFTNLQGKKYLKIFPESGHENYLKRYPSWRDSVKDFMDNVSVYVPVHK